MASSSSIHIKRSIISLDEDLLLASLEAVPLIHGPTVGQSGYTLDVELFEIMHLKSTWDFA